MHPNQYIVLHLYSILLLFFPEKSTNFAKVFSTSHSIPLVDCMSLSCKFKTLGGGNSYFLKAELEMSAHGEEVTREVEVEATEGNEENS